MPGNPDLTQGVARRRPRVLLVALALSLSLVSCVMVPTGADYYGGGYGGTTGWQGERWQQSEAHRREMVRRQEAYRRKMAERERSARMREEDWRREEYLPPGPRYEIEPRREERREDPPPELSPQRRLDPPEEAPRETPRREIPRNEKTDHPMGIPIPGKEGMVYNPIGKEGQMIDVRGIPSGTLVKDPYTDTLFRVP